MTDGRIGVALLGATGSIGRSALNVLARHRDRFRVVALTGARRAEELDRLAREVDPEFVVLAEPADGGFQPTWAGDWRVGSDALAAAWGTRPVPETTSVFLCGNPAMIDDMLDVLDGEGFRRHTRAQPGQVFVEKYW